MRIVIDLQGAQTESRHRGIGRYSLSLALAMVRNRGKHEILIALSGLFPDTVEPIRAEFDGLLPQENILLWQAPTPVCTKEHDNFWRHNVAERIRETFLASLHPDIVHVSSLFEGEGDDGVTSIDAMGFKIPTVVTLFDLIPLLQPDIYLKPSPRYKEHYLRKIEHLKNASALLTISEFTTRTVLENLDFEPTSVTNISAACDQMFCKVEITSQDKKQLFEQYGIERPFVMYSGGFDARKNHKRLFQAYAKMSNTLRNAHQLVIVGKGNTDALTAIAKNAGLKSDEVIFTGYVDDNDLVKFYNQCSLFVFPSWAEGFGLPALEAMACGAAVIASNTSSLPEVIGRDDALFTPYSETEITAKLTELLSNIELRASYSKHGLEQAKKFSWDKCAQHAILAFEKLNETTKKNTCDLDYDTTLTKLITAISNINTIDQHSNEHASIAHSISISLPEKKRKQLFIDISELVQRDAKTGVQRVTRSILNELLDNPPLDYIVEPVYATLTETNYRYARHFTSHFSGTTPCGEDEYIEYKAGDLFLGIDLQHQIIQALASSLTSMRQQGVKIFFVVYDLLPIQFPEYWPSTYPVDVMHAEWLGTISQFDGAICISHAVADELTDWLNIHGSQRLRPFEISWFHLGADVESSIPSCGLPENSKTILNGLSKNTSFLMVGTIEPRKCYEQVLSAFEKLWSEDIDVNLVIVGKQGWMVEELIKQLNHHSELGKRLFWLDGISDEFLEKVYTASTCLIAASKGEGFGLPLIEAAQHELPIIARDIPVFREVAGEHAFYFDNDKPAALATKIRDWLSLNELNQHPSSGTLPWKTWKQSAAQLLDALEINTTSHNDKAFNAINNTNSQQNKF